MYIGAINISSNSSLDTRNIKSLSIRERTVLLDLFMTVVLNRNDLIIVFGPKHDTSPDQGIRVTTNTDE